MAWSAGLGAFAAIVLLMPLARKWALPMKLVIAWAMGLGATSGLSWSALSGGGGPFSWRWALAHAITVLAVSAAAAALAFFRDPDRVVPETEGAIVSPADGRVLYVRRVRRGEVPPIEKRGRSLDLRELASIDVCDRGYLIGIGMHLLNVHVNRAPIAGRAESLIHTPGAFKSLRAEGATTANERFTTVIQGDRLRVAVVQIASRLVRRIVTYLEPGESIDAGQRIGMIRLGSQVDVILPEIAGLRIVVRPGDAVRAGQSILGFAQKHASVGDVCRAGGNMTVPIRQPDHGLEPASTSASRDRA